MKKLCCLAFVGVISAGALNPALAANYTFNVTNATACPLLYDAGPAKINVDVNSSSGDIQVPEGQQVAIYEQVKLNGVCTQGASTSSASLYYDSGAKSYVEKAAQGATAWTSDVITMTAVMNGKQFNVGSGQTVQQNVPSPSTTPATIRVTVYGGN